MLDKELQLNSQIPYGMTPIGGNAVPMEAGAGAEAIKKGVDNSYLSKRVKHSEENSNLLPAATLATWLAIAKGMDVFNKKCDVDYEKTPLGKVGRFGDWLTEKVTGSRLAKSSFGQWCEKAYKSTGKFINDKIVANSAILRALKTPSEPTNKMVIAQAKGLLGFLSQDTEQIFNSFIKSAEKPIQLEQYGADKQFIKNLKNAMKAKGANPYALLKEAEMKLLGIPQADIDRYIQGGKVISPSRVEILLRNAKIEKLGFTPKEYKAVSKDFLANSDKVIKALEKASKNNGHMFISRYRTDGFWGKIQNHLYGRKIGLKELYNKYLVTLGKNNPKHTTKLGKGLAKAFGLFMEGTTNRFAGGKLAVLMQAGIFADMLVNTFKAPKGEKGKTFIERFTNDFAYFLCIPFGIQLLHKFGGLQYAGMSKAEVANYRAELKQFNHKVITGQLSKKGDYINELEKIRGMLRSGRKNIFSKILGRAAEVATVGLESVRGYHNKAIKPGIIGAIKDFFVNPKFYMKNIAGYPMRLLLVMGVIMPPLANGATKLAHAIFGRPTHSVLDDEDEESVKTEQQKQMQDLLNQLEAEKQRQQAQQPIVHTSPTNLINQYLDVQAKNALYPQTQQPIQPQQQVQVQQLQQPTSQNIFSNQPTQQITQSANQSSADTIENNKSGTEPIRTYIPSPTPVVLNAPNTDKADAALRNAAAAEKLARDTLAMG